MPYYIHSLGFVICLISALLLLFPWVTRTKILLLIIMAGASYLARSGGTSRTCPSLIVRSGNCSQNKTKKLLRIVLAQCFPNHQIIPVCIASAGTWMHNSLLPPMLQEGPSPTEAEVKSHDKSLFTPRLSMEAFNEEWHVVLDSLAW